MVAVGMVRSSLHVHLKQAKTTYCRYKKAVKDGHKVFGLIDSKEDGKYHLWKWEEQFHEIRSLGLAYWGC